MQNEDEIIIHRSNDGYGPIVVTEDALTRILYFGSRSRQSRMLIGRPAIPLMPYMQAIIAGLLFRPAPEHVTILGLGGGVLASFFLEYFPATRVTVVELRQRVVDIAQEYFSFPESHPRLNIVVDDAVSYMKSAPPSSDLVIVDLFDATGPILSLRPETSFLDNCHCSLDPEGLLVINYWNRREDRVPGMIRHLQEIRPQRTVAGYEVSPVQGNLVLYSLPWANTAEIALQMQQHEEILQQNLMVDFSSIAQKMNIYQRQRGLKAFLTRSQPLVQCD